MPYSNKIICNSIGGYSCSDSEIEILDKTGNLLYYMLNPTHRDVTFNMPIGKWFTNNELHKLKRPLRYVCPELAAPHKNIPIRDLDIRIGRNENKCSVNVRTGGVLIDPEIWNSPKPFLNFVLNHEIGHFYYKGGIGEHLCDAFAAKVMLEELGFNPSQVLYGQEFCLSDRSIDRKDFMYDWLKQVKCYE